MPLDPNYQPSSGDGGHYNPDGSFSYPNGTVATLDEINAGRKAKGLPPLGIGGEAGRNAGSGSYDDPINPDVPEPQHLAPDSPGSSLDTSLGDESRLGMDRLLGNLQQQAATGGGAWETSLKAATDKATAAASALGQSQPGAHYASALRNIGNAQGAAEQQAVGQGNILREQSKSNAQDQLTGLLGAQGGQDIQQASDSADAKYGPRQLNATAQQQANKLEADRHERDAATTGNWLSTMGQLAGMSDGGRVPGSAPVFGDDSRNDTVPAKLSPGEIVIPRSHASSPEAAADFVRALQAQKGRVPHFDSGGTVPEWEGWDPFKPGFDVFKGNNVAQQKRQADEAERAKGQEAPSIGNGGLLDPTQFNQNRANVAANQQALDARATGTGPSVAPQMIQNAADDGIAAGMRAGVRGAPIGSALTATGQAVQAGGGRAVATAADEQMAGQVGAGKSLVAQRARDQGMALAQQQAAWRNTQLNSGIGLENMALMNSIANAGSARTNRQLAGGAQALAAYSAAAGGEDRTTSHDYAKGGPADLHDSNDLWTGGLVRKQKEYARGGEVEDTRGADFVRALKRAR